MKRRAARTRSTLAGHRRVSGFRASTTAFLAALLPSLVSGCGGDESPAARASAEPASPAEAWHDSVLAAMGGPDGWETARYIEFRWNVVREGSVISDRRHRWDRYTGDYRLEMTDRNGDSLLALFNVQTRDGRVWLAGDPVRDARADSLVGGAYAAFINDSYWLLMPYKWRDPGVEAEYQGTVEHEDGAWHVVHLAFDSVGLTPGDQYWAYIDDEPPHLMRKWQYHLQSQSEKGAMIRWENWQRFGPILLATDRVPADGSPFRIQFREVEVSDSVPAGAFEPPPGG